MKVKIIKKKLRPFKGDEGQDIDYFWYDAIRLEDSFLLQFGSRDGGHETGKELDLELVSYNRKDGQLAWKELLED